MRENYTSGCMCMSSVWTLPQTWPWT